MFRDSNYSISLPLLLHYCYSTLLIIIIISRVLFGTPAVCIRKQCKPPLFTGGYIIYTVPYRRRLFIVKDTHSLHYLPLKRLFFKGL